MACFELYLLKKNTGDLLGGAMGIGHQYSYTRYLATYNNTPSNFLTCSRAACDAILIRCHPMKPIILGAEASVTHI